MSDLAAIRNALYLFHMPSAVRQARGAALPGGVTLLLEIAAGEDAVTEAAATTLERSAPVLKEAAAFFIEQVLLAPEADSYRVLGSTRETSNTDLRRNMALLLRWAHPDADRPGARAVFANRVNKAWENLKTVERRTNYDATHPVSLPPPSRDARARAVAAAAKPAARGDVKGGEGLISRTLGLLLRARKRP